MHYLLDTNILIWWLAGSDHLSQHLRDIIATPRNTCFVSSASIWEIEVKKNLGKLSIADKYFEEITRQDFIELQISHKHARQVAYLENIHKDPFDRLLIAQAITEQLTLITADRQLERYAAKMIFN